MEYFSIFIGALILLVNLILISRVAYTYVNIWIDRYTSLQTKKVAASINYEKLANKAFENILPSQKLTVSVALKFNSPTSPTTYEEKHTVFTTDDNGFSIQLGQGKITKGSYHTLAWGGHPAFMKISINENHHDTLHGDYAAAFAS